MATAESNKRRRKSSRNINQNLMETNNSLHINDIPHALLGDVASYLPTPSRAFFAMAITAPRLSWMRYIGRLLPSAAGSIILSSTQWESLDLGDVEKSLAEKLTDVDLCGALWCINAKTTLKILKLTGCINISGRGLAPLRDSTVLQQIDLSLVGYHESPDLPNPEPVISEAVVLPILHSIIDAKDNLLKHIQLPAKWRDEPSTELGEFLEKYHQLMENRRICCSMCDMILQHDENDEELIDDKWYEDDRNSSNCCLQNHTCCKCLKFFCDGHYEEDNNPSRYCCHCERLYCMSCAPTMDSCLDCCDGMCKECEELTECEGCQIKLCKRCMPFRRCCNEIKCRECKPLLKCKGHCYERQNCEGCVTGKECDVERCEECEETFCFGCRTHLFNKNGSKTCSGSPCVRVREKVRKAGLLIDMKV